MISPIQDFKHFSCEILRLKFKLLIFLMDFLPVKTHPAFYVSLRIKISCVVWCLIQTTQCSVPTLHLFFFFLPKCQPHLKSHDIIWTIEITSKTQMILKYFVTKHWGASSRSWRSQQSTNVAALQTEWKYSRRCKTFGAAVLYIFPEKAWTGCTYPPIQYNLM